jgi:hypothetical protein
MQMDLDVLMVKPVKGRTKQRWDYNLLCLHGILVVDERHGGF